MRCTLPTSEAILGWGWGVGPDGDCPGKSAWWECLPSWVPAWGKAPPEDTPMWTENQLRKHYLPATSFAGGKTCQQA